MWLLYPHFSLLCKKNPEAVSSRFDVSESTTIFQNAPGYCVAGVCDRMT